MVGMMESNLTPVWKVTYHQDMTTNQPRINNYADHYGNCTLHGLPCCSVCCKHENECEYGDCNRPAVTAIDCYADGGRYVETREACKRHAVSGPLGVGYGAPIRKEVAA